MTVQNRRNAAYGRSLKYRIKQDGPIEPEMHSETGYILTLSASIIGGIILFIYTMVKYLPDTGG